MSIVLTFLKRAALPLIVVVAILLVPAVRGWLTAYIQAHPLWSALVLGVAALCVGYFLPGDRGPKGVASGRFHDAVVILAIVLVLLGVGFFLTTASTTLAPQPLAASAFRTSMLWACACFMTGFLGGFLFGVPKVAAEGTAPAANGSPGAAPLPRQFAQRPNTNLEQISDWLTKIIVGLGLVELRAMPEHLKRAATWVAQTLTSGSAPNPATISFAGSVIVYFAIMGFLAGYLLTLLFLAGAFGRAGQQAYGGGTAAFGDDNLSDKIRDYWRPNGGPPDPPATQKLTEWIGKNLSPDTGISELISTKDLDAARKKVVADLSIQ